jgi:hypothetical protein
MKRLGDTEDLTNREYGLLTVLRFGGIEKQGIKKIRNVFMWICKCKCNNIQIVNAAHLKRKGGVKSCGCLRKSVTARMALKCNEARRQNGSTEE